MREGKSTTRQTLQADGRTLKVDHHSHSEEDRNSTIHMIASHDSAVQRAFHASELPANVARPPPDLWIFCGHKSPSSRSSKQQSTSPPSFSVGSRQCRKNPEDPGRQDRPTVGADRLRRTAPDRTLSRDAPSESCLAAQGWGLLLFELPLKGTPLITL